MNLVNVIIRGALSVKETTEEIAKLRQSICKDCNKNDEGVCAKCGCILEIKTTLDYNRNPKKLGRIEKTHCPLGKWPFIDDDGYKHFNDKALVLHYKQL